MMEKYLFGGITGVIEKTDGEPSKENPAVFSREFKVAEGGTNAKRNAVERH